MNYAYAIAKRWGDLAQDEVRRLHVEAGDYVVPTYAICSGGAPKLVGLLQRHVLPDLQVFNRNGGRWIEVKYKDHLDKFQKRKQWQQGIDLPHWHDYCEVEQKTGLPGQLDIIQLKPGKEAEPDPVLLWQSFNVLRDCVQIKRTPHASFTRGIAYFPIEAFKCRRLSAFVPPETLPSLATNVNPWEKKSKTGTAPQWEIKECDESPFERSRCPQCGDRGLFGFRTCGCSPPEHHGGQLR
jgi:hypothetical protein